MTDSITGFDPKHDTARTPNGAKVKGMYEKLVNRGEEDAAEELRHIAPVSKQLVHIKDFPQFDPACDDVNTTSKARVVEVYDALKERGHHSDAEELREVMSVRGQNEKANDYRKKYGLPRPGASNA